MKLRQNGLQAKDILPHCPVDVDDIQANPNSGLKFAIMCTTQ